MATMQEEASTSIVKADRAGRTRYTDQYKAEDALPCAGCHYAVQGGIERHLQIASLLVALLVVGGEAFPFRIDKRTPK